MVTPELLCATILAPALAALLWVWKKVTTSGALAGMVLMQVFLLAGGWWHFLLFFLLVGIGVFSSRGPSRRTEVTDGDHAPRDAGQALANCGVAALATLLLGAPLSLVLAGAVMGTALSDTMSTELGSRFGGEPRQLLLGRRVPPGTNGGMTPLGTVAGLCGALVMGLATRPETSWPAALAVACAAFSGNIADSLLGATVESWLPTAHANNVVNVTATLCGAAVMLLLSCYCL